jgi:hypothetical protein
MSEQNLKDQIIERAQADAAFRAELVADPKAAIHAAFGVELPVGMRVVEEAADEVVLVLPAAVADAVGDRDLEAVAGGKAQTIFTGAGDIC